MTAEKLEELQCFVNRADNDEIDVFDSCDPYWAASLARRVIAAEKLVEAIADVRGKINHRWHTITGDKCIIVMDEAITAYREASK